MKKDNKLSVAFLVALNGLAVLHDQSIDPLSAELRDQVCEDDTVAVSINGKTMFVSRPNRQCNPKPGTTTLSVKSGENFVIQAIPRVANSTSSLIVFSIEEGEFKLDRTISPSVTAPSASGCSSAYTPKLSPRSMNSY